MNDKNEQEPIKEEEYAKYKEIFDKYKNESNEISGNEVNNILNEYGRKTTLKQTEELIKKVNQDNERSTIDFNNFVKLMKTENVESLESEQNQNDKKTLTNCQIYLFMLLLLITGSINTSANKLQQNTVELEVKYAGHQKFITFCMFNGELLCLLFYWIKEGRFANKNKEGKSEALITESGDNEIKTPKKPKIWYFLFPAIFDILGSTISSISLSFLPSSIYQMFRGAVIIFTCSSSIIFLKNKYYRHHFFGIFVVVIGLIVVGLNAVLYGSSKASKNPGFGIFLCVLSQAFSSMLMVTEEKLLKGYETPPLKAVGLEGMWGVICYIFLLVIFYFISCESWPDFLKEGICIQEKGDIYRFENAIFAFKQIWESRILKLYLSLYVLSIAFFNFSGLTISKNVSSTARTIVDTLRTIVIWLFFLTMPFLPEETKETFSWLQLVGFLVLILGSLIYNEILVIPFCGCEKNTKEAIKKRQKQKEGLEKALGDDNPEENENEDNPEENENEDNQKQDEKKKEEKKEEEKKEEEKKEDNKKEKEQKEDNKKEDEKKEDEGN